MILGGRLWDGTGVAARPNPGILVRNVYFDVTPARLVSAWIDEEGARTSWPDG